MMLLSSLFVSAAVAAVPPPSVHVGEPALLFSLPAINEEQAQEAAGKARVNLSDFTGAAPPRPKHAVVVHFFDKQNGASELAVLSRVQKRWASKDVQVVGISTDTGDLGPLSTWIEGMKLSFPVVRDNHGVVQGRYGITDLPMTFVVDGGGYVFAIGRPTGAEAEAAIEAELAPLVK